MYLLVYSPPSDTLLANTSSQTAATVEQSVREQIRKLGINYPVAIDNNYAIWRAFDNQYWPAHYVIDTKGQIRYSHFGEGRYDTQEQVIQKLLEEAKTDASAPKPL
jgi:peroxiredoxin